MISEYHYPDTEVPCLPLILFEIVFHSIQSSIIQEHFVTEKKLL